MTSINSEPSMNNQESSEKIRNWYNSKEIFEPMKKKRKLNTITNEVKKEIWKRKNSEWDKKSEALTTDNRSLWKMALTGKLKKGNIPSIKSGDEQATTEEEEAEIFAKMLQKQFTLNEGQVEFNDNMERIGRRRDERI
ncbi:hypothetical protein WA026_023523 [Henosepilachna vigintioctopunctata]|uniref:Uncharacterized protein n=1 Tax=Henosepilachna vigintioctopunctata TaxID=420089 RepID=A0AAW1TYI5_9CUCU